MILLWGIFSHFGMHKCLHYALTVLDVSSESKISGFDDNDLI